MQKSNILTITERKNRKSEIRSEDLKKAIVIIGKKIEKELLELNIRKEQNNVSRQ